MSFLDYQPSWKGDRVAVSRCVACGRRAAPVTAVCPWCGGAATEETVAAEATVWASTVIHLDVGAVPGPVGFAYADLTASGPRVLVALKRPVVVPGGTSLVLSPADASEPWWAFGRVS